jgi:hypothetical protein
MRALSDVFIEDLSKPDGLLYPVLEHVRKDDTLMISIRENYINVYYRGGNILKLTEQSNGVYQTFFDEKYNITEQDCPDSPDRITSQNEAKKWVDSFSARKSIMDGFLHEHPKPEREFQQLVARENNTSTISNESEYFISDIEFADSALGARFDLLAIRWLASQRQDGSKCRAALIEMKYGDGALGGKAGLLKHLQDIDALVSDLHAYADLLMTMESQFNQFVQLGLLNFNQCKNGTKVKLDSCDKPEVIFLLANHNPRSSKLKTILDDPEIRAYKQSQHFDLKFYVACFAGYGLHADCMLDLAEFQTLL